MKRVWSGLFIILLVVTVAFIAVACGNSEELPTVYTISYTDAAGAHSITVQDGALYSFSELPTREGYEFVGLFDAEVGGTKYVSAQGAALSAFTDKKNIMLFAQFKPKEYVVVLDYQGATITGGRQFTVEYDALIPDLPTNLSLEHKVFVGWFTEPDRGGTQVADEYGNIPSASRLTAEAFSLSNNMITLYAGFEKEKYTVMFYADGKSQEMKVEHGEPITSVVPDFRKDGMAVLSWSIEQGEGADRHIFSDVVTYPLILYAVEWAPVLELDSDGGSAVVPVVAKAGTAITLPSPTKKGYSFNSWYAVGSDTPFTATVMPETSMRLVAHWDPPPIVVSLDARGGACAISATEVVVRHPYGSGSSGSLPTPTYEGYEFAGWYTAAVGGNVVTDDTTMTNQNAHTLYAHWTPRTYNVSLDVNGGSINGERVTSYVYGVGATLPTDVTKSDYIFAGWFTENAGKGDFTTQITSSAVGDKTYYASWVRAEAYSVIASGTSESLSNSTKKKTFSGNTKITVEVPAELQKMMSTGRLHVRITVKCSASLKYRAKDAEATATIKASIGENSLETLALITAHGGGWGALSVDPTYGSPASSSKSMTKSFAISSANTQFNLGYQYAVSFSEYTNWAGGTHAVIFSCNLSNVSYQFYVE